MKVSWARHVLTSSSASVMAWNKRECEGTDNLSVLGLEEDHCKSTLGRGMKDYKHRKRSMLGITTSAR